MFSTLTYGGFEMRLMRLNLASAEAGPNRWTKCLMPPARSPHALVNDGVGFGPRLGTREQTRIYMLSESRCPLGAPGFKIDGRCRRISRLNPSPTMCVYIMYIHICIY